MSKAPFRFLIGAQGETYHPNARFAHLVAEARTSSMSTAATLASFNATILEMKARLAAVEAAESQGTQEINTFYLMWAGADLGLERECQSPPITHASAPSCEMRRCAHLPHAGWFRHPQRWLHSRQERQQHPAQSAHAAPCPMLPATGAAHASTPRTGVPALLTLASVPVAEYPRCLYRLHCVVLPR